MDLRVTETFVKFILQEGLNQYINYKDFSSNFEVFINNEIFGRGDYRTSH